MALTSEQIKRLNEPEHIACDCMSERSGICDIQNSHCMFLSRYLASENEKTLLFYNTCMVEETDITVMEHYVNGYRQDMIDQINYTNALIAKEDAENALS